MQIGWQHQDVLFFYSFMSFKYICNYMYVNYLILKLSIFSKTYALHLCWLFLYLSLIIQVMIKGQHITKTECSEAWCIEMERQPFLKLSQRENNCEKKKKSENAGLPQLRNREGMDKGKKTFLEQNIRRHNGEWNMTRCEKEQETCKRPFR